MGVPSLYRARLAVPAILFLDELGEFLIINKNLNFLIIYSIRSINTNSGG